MTALAALAAQSRDSRPQDTAPAVVRHYTVIEIAELLGVGRSSVYELIDAGLLPAVSLPSGSRTGKARLRVRADDLARFQADLPAAKAG